MRRAAAVWALLAATLAAAAGCASEPPPPAPRQPYKVVLLPVQGASQALSATAADAPTPGEDGDAAAMVPLSLTPAQLEAAIFDGIRASNAFTELVVAPESVAAASGAGDDLSAAAEFARSTNADLVLRVTVKSARIRDLGNNGSTFWSTVLWFMVPAPVWFADDRTYDTNLAVEAALFDPRDFVKPTASVVAASGRQELDLWDRGLSPYVPLVPPPFLAGDAETVSRTVTERAVAQVMDALVAELRTREIPSRFEVALAWDEGRLRIDVATRRLLRSLEVWVDGARREVWAETALVPEKDGTEDRRVYRREVRVAPAAGRTTEVRVVVEDEIGGREVRTIVVGRGE